MSEQKVFQKINQQKAQRAIPDEILEKMASRCRGDRIQILQKMKEYRDENVDEILFLKNMAQKELLRQHDAGKKIKEDNKQAFSEIEKIIKSASDLKEKLSVFPDLKNLSEDSALSGLAMHMETYIYAIDNWGEYENLEITDSNNKLKDWSEFLCLLDHHISVFEEIKNNLSFVKKRGRPNTVQMLEGYITCMANMYFAATGRKFTVGEYGDDFWTDGMRFVYESMAALKILPQEGYQKYRTVLALTEYSDENFLNACDYAQKNVQREQVNLLGKKMDKSA